jgi:hypothetical protein
MIGTKKTQLGTILLFSDPGVSKMLGLPGSGNELCLLIMGSLDCWPVYWPTYLMGARCS